MEPFYTGDIAEDLVADIQAAGGILTVEDMKAYAPRIIEPLHTRAFGHHFYGVSYFVMVMVARDSNTPV